MKKERKDFLGDKVMEIALKDIIEPGNLKRNSEESDRSILELSESIEKIGLIEPIVVKKHYSKWRIIAGHRRFDASYRAKKETIRAIEAKVNGEEEIIMRWEENEAREDISDYDRMRFIEEMLLKTKMSQKDLSEKIGKSEGYVSQRMSVWQGNEDILILLKEGRITYSVARELNKAPSREIAVEMIPFCIDGAANAKQVGRWISESVNRINTEEANENVSEEVGEIRKWVDEFTCDSCGGKTQKIEMVIMRLCRRCAQAIADANRQIE